MNDRDFYDFVYDQYKSAFDVSNELYQRASTVLTALVVVGGGVIAIGRTDLIRSLFDRVDVFFYHLFAASGFVCVVVAVAHLLGAVTPRDYPKVSNLAAWRKWRQDCLENDTKSEASEQSCETRHEATCREGMLDRMIDAADKANAINQTRLVCIKEAIRLTAFGAAALAGQALMSFLLKLQGI